MVPGVQDNNAVMAAKPVGQGWGWLAPLSLTSAGGVFLVALAGYAGRVGSHWADLLFWLGLFVLLLPSTLRLVSPKPARRERIALLVMLGSALYLFRELEYPISFAYTDEFIHWRIAQYLAASGHLFSANPLLPIGPFYPGLEILTNALSSLTGLSIFASGMIVLGVAGLVLVLALYLFYECLSGSARLAGIATLLYAASPDFFGNTQFAYESLAIPLAAFVLFALVRRSYAPVGRRVGLTLAIWLGLGAVVITHHVTSYLLVAILLLWTVTFRLARMGIFSHQKRDQKDRAGPGGVALLGLVLCIAWLKYTGDMAVGYLGPTLDSAVQEFIQILTNQGAPRQLFHDGSGFVEPLWERLTAFASVVFISLGLPFGLFQIWRHFRANAITLALAIATLVYPVSQLARLTLLGEVVGGRTQAYVFVPVALVLVIGSAHFRLPGVRKWSYSLASTGAIAVIFIGGWVLGTGPLWFRLPGPYMVSADHRSINPESVAAAEWARSYLGPGHRMISDWTNMNLMATYGNEWVVTTWNDPQIIVSSVFLAPQFDSSIQEALRRGQVQYILVDFRFSTALPSKGFYYDNMDPTYTRPIDPATLAKFDGIKNVSRVFDSGNIIIYDVEAITNGGTP